LEIAGKLSGKRAVRIWERIQILESLPVDYLGTSVILGLGGVRRIGKIFQGFGLEM
jgi:hypothetical protein